MVGELKSTLARRAPSRSLQGTVAEAPVCHSVTCNSLQNQINQLRAAVTALQNGGSPTPTPTPKPVGTPTPTGMPTPPHGYCATFGGKTSRFCQALRYYLARCRARFGTAVLRCNSNGATACVSSQYKIVDRTARIACVPVNSTPKPKPTPRPTPRPAPKPTTKPATLVQFCGTSVADYLVDVPDLFLSLTIAFGTEVAYMYGSNPTQRVVLFAPTDAAWTVAASILGVNMVNWRAGKISDSDASIVISLMLYNTIQISRTSVNTLAGQRSVLVKSKSAQSQLGVVTSRTLKLSFSQSGTSTYAIGKSGRVKLNAPHKLCSGPWSVVYKTDTVLLPSTVRSQIPIAAGYTG